MFFLDLECLSLYLLVVQYFCQWLHYDKLWKIRTFEEPNQPELWKTTLRGWSFITSEGGLAILLSGHFQNLDLEVLDANWNTQAGHWSAHPRRCS